MIDYIIGCCYFPTTVLFVDDNYAYLKSLRTRLDRDLAYKFYTEPEKAVAFLKDKYIPTTYIEKLISNLKDTTIDLGNELEANELTHSYTDINVEAIHKEIYSPARFNEISVVVVDYTMPKLNGIDFCQQIENLPVKKLMVTGQAGYDLGVDALNSKIIDKFIVKDTPDFRNNLNSAISELQHRYFSDLSATVIGNLTTTPRCCLNDPVFVKFFTDYCNKNNIVEYYLVKDSGSMLLLNIVGEPSWLIIESVDSIEKYHDFVIDSDGPEDIATALKDKSSILFLLNREDEYIYSVTDWDKWRKCLYPANKLVGEKNTYYYAIVDGSLVRGSIDIEKITSYQEYLSKA